jgi:PAT family beta-lactamase induction signal transducer AmpG
VDRYRLPFLGGKRGFILASQVVLFALGVAMAAAAVPPLHVGLIGALCVLTALASATQDIAYDGYAVEVLRKEEHGLAVGARTALYRAAMWMGRVGITAAGWTSWAMVHMGLATLYLPCFLLTWRSAEPEGPPLRPRSLREALWEPFAGFLAQHRALEILAFVVLFKLSDNLTQALTGPFLIQMGYSNVDVGVAAGTVGMLGIVAGSFAGGLLAEAKGLGMALWISGVLQMLSNLGYAVVAEVGVNRPVMYAAQAFEMGMSGLGTGAFGVLLLRLTQKRFSATQYALLSSLFSLPRILAGPPAGLLADAMGWRDFFVSTLIFGLPGLYMLHRFVPWGTREPTFQVAPPSPGRRVSRGEVLVWGVVVGAGTGVLGVMGVGLLSAVKAFRRGDALDLLTRIAAVAAPRTLADWMVVVGLAAFAAAAGLITAAALATRGGLRPAGE